MGDAAESFFRNKSIWKAFLRNTLDCVLDIDFETRKMHCSTSLMQSLRLTPPALPRTLEQWLELYHPNDYAKSLEFHNLVFESTKNAFSLERRLYCGDGVYRLFRMNAVCLRDKLEKIKRLILIETDISDQKRDEPELTERLRALDGELSLLKSENSSLSARLSQKTLQTNTLERRVRLMTRMIDATPDLLFHCDASGRLLICNEAFSNALAYNPDLVEWAADLTRTGRHMEAERRYDDAYGRTRSLFAEARAVSLNGDEDGYVGMARDTTEAEEMRADMERLKRLFGKRALTHETGESQPPAYGLDGEPHDMNLSAALELRLQKAFQAFSPVSALFPTRIAQLENLVRSAKNAELEVGVIGITSSGKSSFINAMMGERLLPEETRATTNL